MIKACIVGYGNIGKSVLEALNASKDIELVGIVRRAVSGECPNELIGIEIVDDVKKLSQKPDVAILCTPSRSVPKLAPEYLAQGINTIDSYDIHQTIYDVKIELERLLSKQSRV